MSIRGPHAWIRSDRAHRRRIIAKDSARGGTGKEEEIVMKQLTANEYDGLRVDQYFIRKGVYPRVCDANKSFTKKLRNSRPIAELGTHFGVEVYMLLQRAAVD